MYFAPSSHAQLHTQGVGVEGATNRMKRLAPRRFFARLGVACVGSRDVGSTFPFVVGRFPPSFSGRRLVKHTGRARALRSDGDHTDVQGCEKGVHTYGSAFPSQILRRGRWRRPRQCSMNTWEAVATTLDRRSCWATTDFDLAAARQRGGSR